MLKKDVVGVDKKTVVDLFHKEAETLKEVRHPHIVRGFESGITEDGVDYLVMEYAPKGTLRDVYPRDPQSRWSLEKVVAMVNDLADALYHLHNDKKKVHLDLNPKNVLRGAYDQLLLSDFGMVKEIDPKSIFRGGTYGYMAPERNNGKFSAKSDLHTLAAMAYEAFTGQRPYHVGRLEKTYSDPPSLVGRIQGVTDEVKQRGIQEVIFKALAYNPDDRCYENVKIFAEALEKACFGRIRWENRSLRADQQNQYLKIAECEEKLLYDPNDVTAHLDKGIALCNLGRDNEALRIL